jgi:Zn-finger nucleic acid-binding protein
MRSYERNGVTVDQCSDCKGIFLDRGELERLSEAEGNYYAERGAREEPRHEEREHRGKPSKKKKASSFLSDLLEGGG